MVADRTLELEKLHKKAASMRHLENMRLRGRRRSVRGEDISGRVTSKAKTRKRLGKTDEFDESSEDSDLSDAENEEGEQNRRKRSVQHSDTALSAFDEDWDDDELFEDDDLVEDKDPAAFDIEKYVDYTCGPFNVDKRNPIRYFVIHLVENKWFTRFILGCIVVSRGGASRL